MRRKIVLWLITSFAMMFLVPWAAVAVVKGEDIVPVSILLFLIVDPLFFLLVGGFCGTEINKLWSLPLFSAVLFLLGAWTFFAPGELEFVFYALAYCAAGMGAMLIVWLVKRQLNR